MPLRKKKLFLNVRRKVPMATKPGWGGAKGLSGRASKKITFFAVSLINRLIIYF